MNKLHSFHTLPAYAYVVIPNFSNIYATKHLMDFLQGMNDSFAFVRTQILLCPKHIPYFYKNSNNVLYLIHDPLLYLKAFNSQLHPITTVVASSSDSQPLVTLSHSQI